MIIEGTRFTTQPCPDCQRPTVLCDTPGTGGEVAVDAEPSKDGTFLLRDAGGTRPVAVSLTVVQQFGKQGTLHQRHTATCKRRRHGR